ncbi:MAG: hydrogen peroxide-inducible genes activator [Pseudomonadales bacterium]|nr:hydrogen peroxide-inducible genes activator [Pseudomonadales bacterium]
MRVSFTELRYMVALAREKNFSRAAESCFVSQPTLSAGLKKLETSLGLQLFERGYRQQLRLTAEGERLLPVALEVIEGLEKFESLALKSADIFSQPVRLGVIYSIGPYLLPRLIPYLNETHPSLSILIEENYTEVLSEKLHNGELDLIIISLPFSGPAISVKNLYEEDFFVAMPVRHRLAGRKSVRVGDIQADELLLLGEGHCLRSQVLEACPACRVSSEQRKTWQGTSLETLCYMVANGAGLTLLPEMAVERQRTNTQLVVRPFARPVPSRVVSLAWRSSWSRTAIVDIFEKAVKVNVNA